MATGLTAAIAFDFFLTQPYRSLAIKSSDDVVATVLMVTVGLAVGLIASVPACRQGRAATAPRRWRASTGWPARPPTARPPAEVAASRDGGRPACSASASAGWSRPPRRPPLPEMEPSGRDRCAVRERGRRVALPPEGMVIALRHGPDTLGLARVPPGRSAIVGISRDRRRTALVLADHLALALAARTGSDAA